METFFVARGYPNDLIRRGRERASIKSRAELLENNAGNNTANDRVPLVTTFHPMNQDACKIISGNFRILHNDSTTNNIFRKPPLMAFRHAKNLTTDYSCHAKHSLLFSYGDPWQKRNSNTPFDITMRSYHGEETCKLGGSYLLLQLKQIADINIGLCCDD